MASDGNKAEDLYSKKEDTMKKIDWLIIFLIVAASLITLRDLYKPNFYTSHDGAHQVVRLYYFDQALRDGQIPPRWAGGLLNGYGYPLFIFSYQLPWIMAEPFYAAGLSIFASIKAVFILGFIISGISMYFLSRSIYGRLAGLGATALYLYAPYRFSNIFVRGAIGDATSFIFLPLLFFVIYKFRDSSKFKWSLIFVGAISIAGALLSHAMVFLFYIASFFLFFIHSLILSKYRRNLIVSAFITTILGLGLSGYYIIPSLLERGLTKFADILGPVLIGATFLNIKELLYSPWAYGVMHSAEGGMSFSVGIAQWLVFFAAGIIITGRVIKGFFYPKKTSQKEMTMLKDGGFYVILFITSILSMLPVSLGGWTWLKRILVVDFTWRILSLTVFAASMLAGYLLKTTRYPVIILIFLITLTVYSNRNHLRINQPLDWPLSLYLDVETTTNTYGEYTPLWVNTNYVKKKRPKIEFTGQNSDIDILTNTSTRLKFRLVAGEEGNVIINTIYYPGWRVLVDGQDIDIHYSKDGMLEFYLEKGSYTVETSFSETPKRRWSNFVSLASASILIGGLIKYRKRKQKT